MKRALVGGSTQGIGRKSAEILAGRGFEVILIARNEEKLKEVVSALSNDNGQKHDYIVADFSNHKTVQEKVNEYVSKNNPIHILINNTGGPPGGPIENADVSEFLAAFEMHLLCNHVLAQAVIPGMKKEGFGRIINVISTSVKQPLAGLGVSNTVRGAVANWSKTMASELGQHNITVNNVLPGATHTGRLEGLANKKAEKTGKTPEQVLEDMANAVPMKRVAQPDEVAKAICFLASDEASYINGINVPVDGGRTGCL